MATLTTLKTRKYIALNKTWYSKLYFDFSSRLLQLNQKPNQLSNPDLSVHSSTLQTVREVYLNTVFKKNDKIK